MSSKAYNVENEALFESIREKSRRKKERAKLIPKDLRRRLKIQQIKEENDAMKLVRETSLENPAALFYLDIPTLKKWILRAERRLKKERETDDSI